jgi:hypothetical protein
MYLPIIANYVPLGLQAISKKDFGSKSQRRHTQVFRGLNFASDKDIGPKDFLRWLVINVRRARTADSYDGVSPIQP